MPPIGPPPHPTRFRREPGAWDLAIVAELPADSSLCEKLSRRAADALGRIPKAIAAPTGEPWLNIVEHADAPTTQRAL